MRLNFDFNAWDAVLLVVVTLMGTALAYLHHPKWKALLISLPFPFTIASLSLGIRINVTHILGLFCLLLYAHAVRVLHVRLNVPIIAAIIMSTVGLGALGATLVQAVPDSETGFWTGAAALFVLSAVLYRGTSHRVEPGHRTPMPVWAKVPVIAAVVLAIIISKKMLQGVMALFPMVTVVAAYEARHSLWTISRQVPAFSLCSIPMLAVIHVAQPRCGLPVALAAGWLVFIALMVPLTRAQWAEVERQEAAPT